jgi:hypothetical protein
MGSAESETKNYKKLPEREGDKIGSYWHSRRKALTPVDEDYYQRVRITVRVETELMITCA